MELKDRLESNPYKDEITTAQQRQDYISFYVESHQKAEDTRQGLSQYKQYVSFLSEKNSEKLFKFLRFPLRSATVVQNDIDEKLEKVFQSANPYFNVVLSSDTDDGTTYLDEVDQGGYFRDKIWKALRTKHNSVLITDVGETNAPYNCLVDIHQVVCLDRTQDGEIKEIVFTELNATIQEQKYKKAYYYYTEDTYYVYGETDESEHLLLIQEPHTLGYCPAKFIAPEPVTSDKWVVRKSIYSNLIPEFEELVTEEAFWKYSKLHGGIPVTSMYQQNNAACGTVFSDYTKCVDGYQVVRNHRQAKWPLAVDPTKNKPCPKCNQTVPVQAGTVASFPLPEFGNAGTGTTPFDMNDSFIKFNSISTETFEQWEEYLTAKYDAIVQRMVGTGKETGRENAQNEKQVTRQMTAMENTLLSLSEVLSNLREWSDTTMLKLRLGPNADISVSANYGTVFYLESEADLVERRKLSTNPIERNNLTLKIIEKRTEHDPDRKRSEKVKFELLPYNGLNDEQFERATVTAQDKELRTNFNYYISTFESTVGVDIGTYVKDFFPDTMPHGQRISRVRETINQQVKSVTIEPIENE